MANILTDIIKTMASPFTSVGRSGASALESLKLLATSPAFRKSVTGQQLNPNEIRELSSYKPTFIEQNKTKSTDYLKDLARQGAGLASYAVPFGKGASIWSKAVMPGAASGGLFEASQPDANVDTVVNSAVTGGVTAGVLNKILGGLTKNSLQKRANTARKGVIDPVTKVTDPRAYEKTQKAVKTSFDRGYSGPAVKMQEQIGKDYNDTLNRLVDAAGKGKNTHQSKNLVDLFKEAYSLERDVAVKGAPQKNVDFWSKQINKIGTELTDADLIKLKQKTLSILGKGKSNEGTVAAQAMDDALSELISKNPELQKIYGELSAIRGVTEGVNKQAQAKMRPFSSVPILGGIQTSAAPMQGIQDLYARGMKGLSNVAPESQDMLVNLLTRANTAKGTMEEPQTPFNPMNTQPVQAAQPEPILSPEGQWRWDAQQNDWIPNTQTGGGQEDILSQLRELALAKALKKGDFAGAMKLYENKQKTTDTMANSFAAEQMIDQILSGGDVSFGPMGGLSDAVKMKLFGGSGASQRSVDLTSKYGVLLQIATKAFQGARMSDADIKFAQENYIPKITDDPRLAMAKLQTLKQILGNVRQYQLTGEDTPQ